MKVVGIDASNLRAGGGQTHLVELLRAADQVRGVIGDVVVWGAPSTLARLPERPWLHRAAEPMLERALPVRLAWQTTRLPRLAREVDLIFAPGGLVPPLARPTVVMCQNMLLFDTHQRRRFGWSRTRIRLEVLRHAQRSSYRRADGVIFLNRSSEEAVRRDLGGSLPPSVVIPHGVSERFFAPPRPQVETGCFTKDQPFRIVYVSAVSVYKNHPALVAAVAAVRRSTPVELLLIGPHESESARAELQVAIAEAQANEFVRWLGAVPYDEIHQHLLSAHACVFPSTCESFGMGVLEAMASGLPVATAALGAYDEVRGDAGLVFDSRNPSSIAQTISRLIADAGLRSVLAKRAFDRARMFTWQHCASETFRFFTTTLER